MAQGFAQAERDAKYAAMREAILRHLWSENNVGLTVKKIAEENGFNEPQVNYQFRTLTRQGLTYAVPQGKESSRVQDLEHLYRDDLVKTNQFLTLIAGERTAYIQKPNIWFLTEAGLALFKSEE